MKHIARLFLLSLTLFAAACQNTGSKPASLKAGNDASEKGYIMVLSENFEEKFIQFLEDNKTVLSELATPSEIEAAGYHYVDQEMFDMELREGEEAWERTIFIEDNSETIGIYVIFKNGKYERTEIVPLVTDKDLLEKIVEKAWELYEYRATQTLIYKNRNNYSSDEQRAQHARAFAKRYITRKRKSKKSIVDTSRPPEFYFLFIIQPSVLDSDWV